MMSEYTKNLSARQLIAYIANDYVELSYDKVRWQRDDYIKSCREWLEHNDKENSFADWLHELQGFTLRSERLVEMFGYDQYERMVPWLKAAFNAGRNEEDSE